VEEKAGKYAEEQFAHSYLERGFTRKYAEEQFAHSYLERGFTTARHLFPKSLWRI
jgi:hypothetical protein